MRWYIVHTYSGYEDKVKESVEQRFAALDRGDLLGEVLIPTVMGTEAHDGKRIVTSKKLFPGYVYVRMLLTEDSWHIVAGTPRVAGFVGGRDPAPLSDDEINAILGQARTAQEDPEPKVHFEVGAKIKIIDGPFANFIGAVDAVDEDKGTLQVKVTIFGRTTLVELGFHEAEMI
ncbi:MAG: transcription termination/antitermination protein NusG [Nannocystaceae bacterium]